MNRDYLIGAALYREPPSRRRGRVIFPPFAPTNAQQRSRPSVSGTPPTIGQTRNGSRAVATPYQLRA
ncbi:MAG: hypothetical protein ACKV2U_31640 [Bryobacteraceae bacterium]